MVTFCYWFFGVWLFPLIPGWLFVTMVTGELQSLNILEWDDEARIAMALWTIVCWMVGAFVLLNILVP